MTNDEYIAANLNRRVEDVALELSRRKDLDAAFVLRQIEGYQRMRTKVPRWTEVEGIHFPPRISLEQCSGQPAAEYKARVAERLSGAAALIDLTGGMGVDFSFIAPLFNTRTYVEQRAELAETARHNLPLLGLADAHIIHGDGVEYLQTLPNEVPPRNELSPQPQTGAGPLLIFLDPARRDTHGGKTVLVEDCEPNVASLLPLLRAKGRYTMVKLSPMLDLHRAVATLHAIAPGCISEVHVFSSGGECKDLLLVITGDSAEQRPLTIHCSDERHTLSYTPESESLATCPTAETIEGYLYEPGPSIMKAGAFRSCAAHYGLSQLAPNSHLFVSTKCASDFQGRMFVIDRVFSFAKADLKELASYLKHEGGKANLTVRNFPSTVAELRKKLKLKEGGTTYLFATTDREGRRLIIACRKTAPYPPKN